MTPSEPAPFSVGSATSEGQRFRILRPHARGGLGAVFVALDGELHREVVLKQILDKHADDPVSRQRFVAEAEITGGLGTPGRRPRLRPGHRSRWPSVLRHAVHQGCLAQRRDRAVPGGRGAPRPTPAAGLWSCAKLLRRFTDVCNAIDVPRIPAG